jgi:hypothetical protein
VIEAQAARAEAHSKETINRGVKRSMESP